MTHDFAKKPKAATKKKKPQRKSQVPGWVWLFTGIVAGVFISFLGYLAGLAPEAAPEKATPISVSNKNPSSKNPSSKTNVTKFDFYTLLPEREVIVPVEQDDEPGQPTQATIYILQAGSFKHAGDADRLRARLILMGLEARVEQISSASGGLWHRVQVGPFQNRSRMNKARNTLINEGIDTLLLKRKA
jgi:cell division protein FtsN